MAVSALSPLSLTPIFDNGGYLARNARLYFYRPDTLDPITVYKDQELSVPHTQPIVTGGSGRVPPIYIGIDPQRVRIFDTANQLVEDINYLPGATEGTSGGPGGGDGTGLETGDVIWRFSNGGVRSGFVRLNGGTIGNAASGASERANDDAYDLFMWLWGQDSQGELLDVLPGRGASAEGDWLANKQIRLPDGANRALMGIATMGRPAEGRTHLAGAIFDRGTHSQPGAIGGRATRVLTVANLPAHAHNVTDPGHAHAASQAAHNHGVTDPGHAHGASQPAHTHSVYDPGHVHGTNDPGHIHAISDPGHVHSVTSSSGSQVAAPGAIYVATVPGGVLTSRAYTGIDIQRQYTGISIAAHSTGISLYNAQPGVTVNGAVTGITTQNAQPAVTVQGNTTGITIQNTGDGEAFNVASPFLLGTWYMKL